MKYLHIMSTGNPVSKSFPHFIRNHFPETEHTFLIIGSGIPAEDLPQGCLLLPQYDHAAIMRQIRKHAHVLIHGLSLSTQTKAVLLLPKFRKKLVWVAWGADLYQDNYLSGTLLQIKHRIDTLLKKRFSFFVGIFKPDIDYFCRKYNKNAATFFAKYTTDPSAGPSVYDAPPALRQIRERLESGQAINILVGHQANPLLGHKTVLDMLSRFKDENIHIYIPLSYGDLKYAEETARYAEALFGRQVTVLRDLIPPQEYISLLGDMDIAIFHIDRQIGLGNIYPLMFMQKKLYLRSSGVMFRHFTAEGLPICPSEDLQTVSFAEFTKDIDMSAATEYVRALHDPKADADRWQAVFSALQ